MPDPEEFRRKAAALVLDSGRSICNVGRELGVNHETLCGWVWVLHRSPVTVRPRSPRISGSS